MTTLAQQMLDAAATATETPGLFNIQVANLFAGYIEDEVDRVLTAAMTRDMLDAADAYTEAEKDHAAAGDGVDMPVFYNVKACSAGLMTERAETALKLARELQECLVAELEKAELTDCERPVSRVLARLVYGRRSVKS